MKILLSPSFTGLDCVMAFVVVGCVALGGCYAGMDRAYSEIKRQQEESRHSANDAWKACLVGKTIRRDTVQCEVVAQGIIQTANSGN